MRTSISYVFTSVVAKIPRRFSAHPPAVYVGAICATTGTTTFFTWKSWDGKCTKVGPRSRTYLYCAIGAPAKFDARHQLRGHILTCRRMRS